MAAAANQLRATLENFKSLVKQAEEMGGPNTSHESENKDNHTEPSQMGSSGKETGEALAAQGGANNVNDATPPSPSQDTQTSQQADQGTKKTLVGGDPSTEGASGESLPDPGTEHPARTDNKSLDGEKYASLSTEQLIHQLHDLGTKIANALLQDPTMGGDDEEEEKIAAAERAAAAPTASAASSAVPNDPQSFARAFLLGQLPKEAAYAFVRDQIANEVAMAESAANRVADYLDLQREKLAYHLQAKAAAEMDPATLAASPDSGQGGPGLVDAAAAMGEGTAPPPDVMQALLGSQGAPTEGGEGEHAEPDGDEDAEGNEPPIEEEGQTVNPQDAAQVEQLLAALGITPDQLGSLPPEQKTAVAQAMKPLLGTRAKKASLTKSAAASTKSGAKKSAKERKHSQALQEFIESTRAV